MLKLLRLLHLMRTKPPVQREGAKPRWWYGYHSAEEERMIAEWNRFMERMKPDDNQKPDR